MKKGIVFFGILAMFFNIFMFVNVAMSEKTYKKQIFADEAGIYQESIEELTEIDWRAKFPSEFNKKCIKEILGDYLDNRIKIGYSFECSPTENIFSLSQGGFLRIPIGEKWLMIIFEGGPNFINIPKDEIRKNKAMNILGSAYFFSILFLFGLIGYFYDHENDDNLGKYFLAGLLGIGSLIIVIFNNLFLSEVSGDWIKGLGLIYLIISLVFITVLVLIQIEIDQSRLIRISIFICALLISFDNLVFFGNLKSSWGRWEYLLFQVLLIGLAWCFGEVVFAWRKEKLFTPKKARARRIFQYPVNFVEEEHC